MRKIQSRILLSCFGFVMYSCQIYDKPIVFSAIGDVPYSEEVVKELKKKREPSAYNKFVKENYSKVADLDRKERFTQLSKMWKESKGK